MTPEEVAVLNAEIHGIKNGIPLTLSSLTLNLSLVSGAYFITRSSTNLNRYSGISGVQYSVAATGTPATTAVYSGVSAGTGETLDVNVITDPTFANDALWTIKEAGWAVSGNKGVATATTANIGMGTGVSIAAGSLVKFASDLVVTTGSARMRFGGVTDDTPLFTTSGAKTAYLTKKATHTFNVLVDGVDAFTGTVANYVVTKVLTPDSTGILAAALTAGAINTAAATYVVTVSKP